MNKTFYYYYLLLLGSKKQFVFLHLYYKWLLQYNDDDFFLVYKNVNRSFLILDIIKTYNKKNIQKNHTKLIHLLLQKYNSKKKKIHTNWFIYYYKSTTL